MENSNAWDAEWEVTEDMAKALIYSQFPQLSLSPVRKLGHGWDNTVYAVGEAYAFRFPRKRVAVNLLEMEGRMLPKLENVVSIPYSKPLFFGKGTLDYPSPFLGYTYLAGKFPVGLTDEQRILSVKPLARFLKSLHSFPMEEARELGVPTDHRHLTDVSSRKARMLDHLSELREHLREEEHEQIEAYLQAITLKQAGSKEVLLHGDLHFKNMLVDETGRLSGVIDWGDMNIGHPACDLNVAYSFVPPGARSEFFKAYGEVEEETKILARLIAVYIPMLILLQAVHEQDKKIEEEAKATILRALT
ncbi:phosphotransferase [Paenibacillus sp. SAF-054]|uniref:phosphotransferase n=1 Tax=unclassified Paenibacillus TaxID=185978 RepID=UPI003F7DE876